MIRNILAVIAGYLIFAVTAVALFSLSGIDPHTDASVPKVGLVVVYGAVFAAIGGYAAHLIASSKTLTVNYVLSFIIAGFAVFSLFASSGSHYTQVATIFLFAPLSLLGGYLHAKRAGTL
ncbi:MAG: hypothetical protein ABJB40_03200 [Acidobacteriota bacterium]